MSKTVSWMIAVGLGVSVAACSGAKNEGDEFGTPDTGADVGADDGGGGQDGVTVVGGGLVINEVASAGEPDDWFELYNGTEAAIDLGGWSFSDDIAEQPQRSPFPDGATIASGAYLHVQFDDEFPGFGLAGDEELGVYNPDGELVDFVDWDEGQSPDGGSYGRIPNGEGDFKTLNTATPGEPNVDNDGGAECGNGTVEAGEACDDGNAASDDGCSAACAVEDGYACDGEPSTCTTTCGDSVVAGDEECDDGNTTDGDGCSASCESETVASDVVINEVVAAAADDGADWIEFYNNGDTAVDVGGWTFRDDDPEHLFTFADGTSIGAGEYLVLERGDDSFDFGLGGEDSAFLFNSDGFAVDSTSWSEGEAPEGNAWGRFPNGTGDFTTLSIVTRGAENENGDPPGGCGDGIVQGGDEECDDQNNVNGDGCSATCAVEEGFTCDESSPSVCTPTAPGECGNGAVEADEACDDSNTEAGDGCSATCTVEDGFTCDDSEPSVCTVLGDVPNVVLNEVTPSPVEGEDWIEFFNLDATEADISGWYFEDDGANRFTFPDGSTIAANGYLVLERDGADSFDFGLGGDDAVTLYLSDGTVVDSADWTDGDAEAGTSWGRLPNGTGDFQTLSMVTRGSENMDAAVPTCGNGVIDEGETCDDDDGADGNGCSATCELEEGTYGVTINEVVAASDTTEDWVELYNTADFVVNVSGWGLTDDEGLPIGDPDRPFVIADGTSVAPGAYLVFVSGEVGSFEFGLGRGGDEVVLYDSELTEIERTGWTGGAADAPTSWGRSPNGTGDFTTLATPTQGASND